jgi:4-hydroxy-tetrahydrodipicolinate reductase
VADPVRLVHYGLGPIGIAVARLAGERAGLRSVAAFDPDPALAGRPLAALTGGDAEDGPVVEAAYRPVQGPAVGLHCTSSRLRQVLPQLLECVGDGLDVVSSCEELAYPWDEDPESAGELDRAARERGVTILGTGVNPGFAMDYLPLALTAVAARVDHVSVVRVQDAASRRLPLQRKIGTGLDPDEFRQRAAAGLLGHVGLRQSAQAIAAALGWRLDRLEESVDPIQAERAAPTALGEVAPGRVLGLRHRVRGFRGEREAISLDLQMAVGLGRSVDEIEIGGEPDLRLVVPEGLHGDRATAAIMVNAVHSVLAAPPGLAVMASLPPPRPV